MGFKFSIDQRVKVLDTDIVGTVDALMLDRGDIRSALVQYFDKRNVSRTVWLVETKLEAV